MVKKRFYRIDRDTKILTSSEKRVQNWKMKLAASRNNLAQKSTIGGIYYTDGEFIDVGVNELEEELLKDY